MEKFSFILSLGIATIMALSCGCQTKPATPASPPPKTQPDTQTSPEVHYVIPSEYQRLYKEISEKLDTLDEYLNSRNNGTQKKITFAAELLPANGHRGEKLLTEENYRGTLVYLDALQSLGIQGVKIAISYPLLAPDFPNSDGYLEYYKDVAQELRKKHEDTRCHRQSVS